MRFRGLIVSLSGLALTCGLAAQARAQQIDYGAFEQLFGQPVTTSATGSPQLAAQAPDDMQIITADDIRRSGATDIPDLLEFVAGIDVRREGALDADVAIRGFGQNFDPRLLVLVNGRQVYNDDYGYVAWQTIPVQLSEIRQIEVVRGPNSALFGFNAVAGVINIITYAPLTDKINVATAGFGTDGTLLGSVVSTVQDPGVAGLRIALGGLKTNEYQETPASTQGFGNARPNQGSVSLSGQWQPSPNTETSLEANQSAASSFVDGYFIPGAWVYRTQSVKFSVSADGPYGLATLTGYTNRVSSYTLNVLVPDGTDADNQITVIQASDLLQLRHSQALRLGLEYRQNKSWGESFAGTISYRDYAADAMWNWQITPQLALTTAGRIDVLMLGHDGSLAPGIPYTRAQYDSARLTAPSFNAGLVYRPTPVDTFRLLAGRGVQAPSLVDFGIQVTVPYGPYTIVAAGDPDIKPTTVTNYEADYDRAVPALGATLSAAVYYQINRDFLLSGISAPDVFSGYNVLGLSQNIGNAEALGGELGASGASPSCWRWNLSYALFTVRQNLIYLPPLTPFDFSNSTPESQLVFGLGYSWDRWEADLHGKFQSRYTDDIAQATEVAAVPIRNFLLLDARVGYSVTSRLTLAVVGDELTAPQITESAALPPDRRLLFTATYGF
jgi:iron complex outermembrane receptor protein